MTPLCPRQQMELGAKVKIMFQMKSYAEQNMVRLLEEVGLIL